MSLAPDHCRTGVGIQMLEESRAVGGKEGKRINENFVQCNPHNYISALYSPFTDCCFFLFVCLALAEELVFMLGLTDKILRATIMSQNIIYSTTHKYHLRHKNP